jgi:hypothetical protein
MFKDPVCNMMVDEKTTKYVSEVEGLVYASYGSSLLLSCNTSIMIITQSGHSYALVIKYFLGLYDSPCRLQTQIRVEECM